MSSKIIIQKWTLIQLASFKPYYKFLYLGNSIADIACIVLIAYYNHSVLNTLPILLIANVIIGSLCLWMSRKKIDDDQITKENLRHNFVLLLMVLIMQYRVYFYYEFEVLGVNNGIAILVLNFIFTLMSCFFNIRYDLSMINNFMFNITSSVFAFK